MPDTIDAQVTQETLERIDAKMTDMLLIVNKLAQTLDKVMNVPMVKTWMKLAR